MMDSFEQETLIFSITRESAKIEQRRARALCREVQTEAMSVSRGSPKVTERGKVGVPVSDIDLIARELMTLLGARLGYPSHLITRNQRNPSGELRSHPLSIAPAPRFVSY